MLAPVGLRAANLNLDTAKYSPGRSSMNRIQKLLFGAVAFAAMAGPALAETPELDPCRAGSKAVTLVIRTDTTSGWTVNGSPVSAVGNGAWVNVSPAQWIGPAGSATPATLTYKITFNTPMMHGPMSLKARWAADNCGGSIRAGNGPVTALGGCTNTTTGKDFLAWHNTPVAPVNFHPNDSASPTSTITVTVANRAGTPAGFAGEFTVTALCTCR